MFANANLLILNLIVNFKILLYEETFYSIPVFEENGNL